jgi:hypothetical protein
MAPAVAMMRDENRNGVPDGEEIYQGRARDQDCDWIIDEYGPRRVRPIRSVAIGCPGGDGDTVGIHLDLHCTCDGFAVIDSGWAFLVRGASSSPDVKLYGLRSGAWVPVDTLPILAKEGPEGISLGATRMSGCGVVVLRVVVSEEMWADSVVVEVRGLDVAKPLDGIVDEMDARRMREHPFSRRCGDLDGSGSPDAIDRRRLDTHLGHALHP